MANLTFDLSGSGGLAPKYYGDFPLTSSEPNLRYLGRENQLAEGIYNPLSKFGYLAPANNTTKAVTGTTSYLLTSALISESMIYNDTGDSIFFSDESESTTQGKVVALDTAIDTSLDTAHTLSRATAFKVVDMITYQVNGTRKIFFSTRDLSGANIPNAADIGIANRDFSSPDEDWGSSLHSFAGAQNGRIKFVLADNGFLYVLDSNAVHKIDGGPTGGTNGTLTNNVLVFLGDRGGSNKTGTIIKDAVDIRGKMWIGLDILGTNISLNSDGIDYDKTISPSFGVYIWNRISTVASMQDFIQINGIRDLKSMHSFQEQPACFTESTDGYTEFRVWDGAKFKVVQRLGKNAYPPYGRHSLYNNGDYIIWIGNDGYIYLFGSIEGQPNALHIIGDMTSHVTANETFSEAGVLVAANDTETVASGTNAQGLAFYISFKDTAGNHLKKWYPFGVNTIASNAQTGHSGNVYSLVKYLPGLSQVNYIQLIFAPGGSGGSTTIATFNVYLNQSTTATTTVSITQKDVKRGFKYIKVGQVNVHAIQFGWTWATGVTLGSDTFLPTLAQVDYSPTTKLK